MLKSEPSANAIDISSLYNVCLFLISESIPADFQITKDLQVVDLRHNFIGTTSGTLELYSEIVLIDGNYAKSFSSETKSSGLLHEHKHYVYINIKLFSLQNS